MFTTVSTSSNDAAQGLTKLSPFIFYVFAATRQVRAIAISRRGALQLFDQDLFKLEDLEVNSFIFYYLAKYFEYHQLFTTVTT